MPELRTARENARLEIGPQHGRNSHQMGSVAIYDLQGLSYGRTELLVADMRLLAPDPSGTPCGRDVSSSLLAPSLGPEVTSGASLGSCIDPERELVGLRE